MVRVSSLKPVGVAIGLLCLAACVWMPCLHLLFRQDVDDYRSAAGLAPRAQALANMALRNPVARDEYLGVIDAIIDETLQLEQQHGIYYFLMDYAREGVFVASTRRSIFEDGEIAMMLAARRFVQERQAYRDPLHERVDVMVQTMRESPVLCGESYPDECWMFCNSIAAAAISMADVLDGTGYLLSMLGLVYVFLYLCFVVVVPVLVLAAVPLLIWERRKKT